MKINMNSRGPQNNKIKSSGNEIYIRATVEWNQWGFFCIFISCVINLGQWCLFKITWTVDRSGSGQEFLKFEVFLARLLLIKRYDKNVSN